MFPSLTKSHSSGYNPPAFILDAARASIDRTDTYQYAPPKGRPSLKQALATTYSPLFARELDPATEILITTGANEGIFSALTAYVEPCDEVLVIEPFFDLCVTVSAFSLLFLAARPIFGEVSR